jgi:multidrug resistance efflux pump
VYENIGELCVEAIRSKHCKHSHHTATHLIQVVTDIQTSDEETEQITVHAPQTGHITQIYCNLKDKISVGDSLLEIDDSTQENMKKLQEEIQKSK